MGEATTRTLNEIAATREALDRDLTALEARLPNGAKAAYGAAGAGGGLAVLGMLAKVASKASERRKHEKAVERDAQVQARAIAAAFAAHDLGRRGATLTPSPASSMAPSPAAPADDDGGSFLRVVLAVLLAVVGAVVATKVRDQRAAEPLWVDEVGDGDLAG